MKLVAEQAARAVAEAFELARPPIDVEALATRLGVTAVVDSELVEDGRLERVSGQSRVLVRAGLSAERRRFTIAHELGHLILNDSNSDLVARRHRIGEDREERFCEDFAAALLLPRAWVRSVAGNRSQTLHTLRVVSGRSNTSRAAACVRLNEVAGWRRTLLSWKLLNGRWGFRWAAGLPTGFDARIRTTDETRDVIRAVETQGGDVDATLPIRVGSELLAVDVQMSVRNGSALALARLADALEKSQRRRVRLAADDGIDVDR